MNLVEAIKTGDRFRRKDWPIWYFFREGILYRTSMDSNKILPVPAAFNLLKDLTATDYEILGTANPKNVKKITLAGNWVSHDT